MIQTVFLFVRVLSQFSIIAYVNFVYFTLTLMYLRQNCLIKVKSLYFLNFPKSSIVLFPSRRPKLVNSYNKNMGGVDTTDAIMKAYSGQRKNKKVHKKVILHLFHRILHNAYILYQKNTCDIPVKSRVKFLQSVVESLSAENVDQIPRRRARQRKTTVVDLPGKKEKDCCVCSDRRRGGSETAEQNGMCALW